MSRGNTANQTCRICSRPAVVGLGIFSELGRRQMLQLKIRKYLCISVIPGDWLPKLVCPECCDKLEDIHRFALFANENQDKFLGNPVNVETNSSDGRSLLEAYLLKGGTEDETSDTSSEQDVVHMEVGLDPMMVVQCSLDDTDEIDSPYNPEDLDEQCENTYMDGYFPTGFDYTQQPPAYGGKRVLGNKNEEEDFNAESECGSGDLEKEAPTCGSQCECPICGKMLSTKGNLKVHVESHRPTGRFTCDYCGRTFKTFRNLCRHKEYHGYDSQYPCTVCGRVYPTNSTLRAHSITHSNVRPHKCPMCDKTFKRNQDLKFHINQHTGARPYQCPYCPKAFASSGNCFSHRKRMHPAEVERDRERAAKIMR